MPRDYYESLGVKKGATEDEIKRAYRKLARQYHPDRNPGDKSAETKFKEVQEAYDVLSDKKKRQQYDQFGFAGPNAGTGGAGTGPFQWGGGNYRNATPDEAAEVFRQFFGGGMGGMGGAHGFESGDEGEGVDLGTLFGQRRGATGRRPRAPAEVESEVTVPFETAASGGKLSINVEGTSIDVTVPPGVKEGQTLRLRGQAPGGGNLLLKIKIAPHPYFRREDNDVILEVPISIAEAVLGAKVEVPTVDGTRLSVKIPPGSSSGSRLRLRGKGINGGDQYIQLQVTVPSIKDERSRELIEEFARLHPQDPRANVQWR
jgi:DnaJ-class molecular chaperone